MGTLQEDLAGIDDLEDKVVKNKVARFAYTEKAYKDNDADGVEEYDVNKEQNIPVGFASVMKVNETVLNRGYRAQASSITRMLMNHFLGRISYNLNKVNDVVSSFIKTVKSHLGSANGIATLDETGRIPYTQLPESAMEFMGTWDASTNTPTLTDGTGRNGNFYVVSVAGTQTFGGVEIRFNTNDRIIYNGDTSSWTKLSSGDVRTVNSIKPDETGNITLDATDVNAVKTINNLSPNKETGNINLGSLHLNGKTYDGSTFLDVGVQAVEYGGTGQTTEKDAANAFINSLDVGQGVTTDNEYYVSKLDPSPFSIEYCKKPVSKLWEYIKGKISSVLGLTASNYGGTALMATNAEQATTANTANKVKNALTINGQSFDGSSALNISIQEGAYDHIVYDDASLLEWANCTEGSMKKVLIKNGTYNMTKGVNLSNAGTGYVLAEQGAVINSHVPVAFEKTNNALCSIYNLVVVCCVSENSSYCTAFKDSYSNHVFNKYLVLYNCKAGYDTVKLCNDYLFLSCWCFNCIFDAVSNTTNGISVKTFSNCYCINCVCTLSIQSATLFEESDFFRNCTCINCRGGTEINVNILNSDEAFCAFHYCYCIACDAVFTCSEPSLSVQSPCYCFNGGTRMSSCYAFADYSSASTRHISGIYNCSYISATNTNNWAGSNSKVDADSCNNS